MCITGGWELCLIQQKNNKGASLEGISFGLVRCLLENCLLWGNCLQDDVPWVAACKA